MKKALEVAPNASFAVHTGDVVETATVEDEWVDILDKSRSSLLNTTLAVNSGNHDEYGESSISYDPETKEYKLNYAEGDTEIYNKHVNVEAENGAIDGGSYYSYEFNGVHFLSLNTNDYKNEAYKAIGEEQLAWIKKDIEEARANGAKWVVLQYHKPIFSKSYHSLQDTDVQNVKDEFMKLIDELDVDLALQGHDHVISRTKSLKYAPYEVSPFYAEVAEEGENVKGIDHYTNPSGTTFVLPNTGGTKAYDDIYNKGIDHIRQVIPKIGKFFDSEAANRGVSAEDLVKQYEDLFAYGGQPSQPEKFKYSLSNNRDSIVQNFARYIVEGNKLTVEMYQIEGAKGEDRVPELMDSFVIEKEAEIEKKDINVPVEFKGDTEADRPKSVKASLFNDESGIEEASAEATKENGWVLEFKDIPMQGQELCELHPLYYYLEAADVEGYKVTVESNGENEFKLILEKVTENADNKVDEDKSDDTCKVDDSQKCEDKSEPVKSGDKSKAPAKSDKSTQSQKPGKVGDSVKVNKTGSEKISNPTTGDAGIAISLLGIAVSSGLLLVTRKRKED